jgi:hypothetical protein
MGDETLGSLVRILLGAKAQRMTARTALSVMERAAAHPPPPAGAGGPGPESARRLLATAPTATATPATTPVGAATMIRAHLMAGGGPRAFAGVSELLDAVRRGPPEQVLGS